MCGGFLGVTLQRRNARVNRVTFNERLNILVLGSSPLLHIVLALLLFLTVYLAAWKAYYTQCSKPVRRNLHPS